MPQAGRSTQLGLTCDTIKDISEPFAQGWRLLAFAGRFSNGGDFVFSNQCHCRVLFNGTLTSTCWRATYRAWCFFARGRMRAVSCARNDKNLQRNQTDGVIFQTVMTGGRANWLLLDGEVWHFSLKCIIIGLVKCTFTCICLSARCW